MQPRNDVVRLRLTTAEREAWSRAAGGKGRLSEWVRAICNTASIPGLEVTATPSAPIIVTDSPPFRAEDRLVAEGYEPCARWMHHRKGVYCGACKQVN